MSEVVSAKNLSERTGFTPRYFQKLAIEGKIGWATQPGGPNSHWRFELDGFIRWWNNGRPKKEKRKGKKWPQSSNRAEASTGTGGWSSTVGQSESPLKQRLKALRSGGSKNG